MEQTKVKKFVAFREFFTKKKITPLSITYLCNEETKSLYRDKDGCVWRMVLKDHDNGDAERFYETQFPDFKEAAKGKKAGKPYFVWVEKGQDGRYSWRWEDIQSAEVTL